MTAKLTIVLGPDALKALRGSQSIRIVAGSAGDARPAPAPRGGAAPRAAKTKPGTYRAGSLPAKLMAWAGGLKKPFGVAEVMGKLKIKRAHASMVLTRVANSGHVKRVGRGAYAAA